MTWHNVLDILWVASGMMILVDNARLRRRLKLHEAERAEAVVAALGDGMVQVDMYTLPRPDDSRWHQEDIALVIGGEVSCLSLGAVSVNVIEGSIYIRTPGTKAPPLPLTPALRRYTAQVIEHARNAAVRKSLEVAAP